MARGKKTGGRTAGTPNSEKKELKALLAEKHPDYHPVIAMADIANDTTVSIDTRLQAHKEVAKYIEPQLKSSEIKQTGFQELIVKRESTDSYPPVLPSSSGSEADSSEPQAL